MLHNKAEIPQYESNSTFSAATGFLWGNSKRRPLPPANPPSLHLCLFFGRRLRLSSLASLFFPLCNAINRTSHDGHVRLMWGGSGFPLSIQTICLLRRIENAAVLPPAWCREGSSTDKFSTDPVLKGVGRGEHWFLQHDFPKWNQIKAHYYYSDWLMKLLYLVLLSCLKMNHHDLITLITLMNLASWGPGVSFLAVNMSLPLEKKSFIKANFVFSQ